MDPAGEVAAAERPQTIVLIGMMGAGKTSVGREVAARLGWAFVDNDERFLARTGQTAATYAAEFGVDPMHRVEAEVLEEILADPAPKVVAAPGSIAELEDVDLSRAFVVWLRAPVEVLATRVRASDHRPLLGTDPVVALRRLKESRRQAYSRLADAVVDVGRRPLEAVTADVLAAWERA